MKHQLIKGFSLIELLFVVAIFTVIITTAMPRFRTYQALNKRKEATQNLNQIYMLMQLKFQEDKSYSMGISAVAASYAYGRLTATTGNCTDSSNWPNEIGFKISPCSTTSNRPGSLPTYSYVINVANDSFTAQACDVARIVSSCTGVQLNNVDRITINERQEISITCDAIGCGTTCSSAAMTCVGGSDGVAGNPVIALPPSGPPYEPPGT